MGMGDPVEAYERWCLATGKAKGSVYLQVRYVRRLAVHGDLMTMSESDIVDWIGAHRWRPETRRSVRSALMSFYSWAQARGWRRDNPVELMPPAKIPPPCPKPAGDGALATALMAATPRERMMLELGALAGMRRAEIAAVRREDLDGDMLTVIGKGGRARLIPLPSDLARRILAHPPGYIFPGRFTGHVCPDHVGRILSRLLGPGLTGHTLRHRYATRCYSGTRDILALQELLGHSSPETTKRYVRVGMDALRATAAAAV